MLEPLPPGAAELAPSPRARSRAAERRARPELPEVESITYAELLTHCDERSADPPIWGAEYLAHDTPDQLGANRGSTATVTVRNTSLATWRSLGQVHGRVLLSYRWFTPDGQLVVPQGDISILPQAVPPGATTTVLAGLWTPPEPGAYRLEWDMLCERVAWFSVRGVPPLSHAVEIVDLGPRPRAPHFAEVHRPTVSPRG